LTFFTISALCSTNQGVRIIIGFLNAGLPRQFLFGGRSRRFLRWESRRALAVSPSSGVVSMREISSAFQFIADSDHQHLGKTFSKNQAVTTYCGPPRIQKFHLSCRKTKYQPNKDLLSQHFEKL
jgi:hypothetical protein